MNDDDHLVLKFDPQTVDHLGAKMYSHLPNAIAELIANAYDADAEHVVVRIGDGEISIEDDGHGMSRSDVADKYLRIGRNRRHVMNTDSTEGGARRVSGKKGLGKLALFGIGGRVELITSRSGETNATVVVLEYDDMMSAEGEYKPVESQQSSNESKHGTTVRLGKLKRTSPVEPEALADSLSKLFNYTDQDFEVRVVTADDGEYAITAERRLASINLQFSWDLPEDLVEADTFAHAHEIAGRIVSSKSPLRHGLRGITLYVNGRLANEPEFFGASESSFAFSYLTGYLQVDFLDEIEPDVIATDRRAIDWETELTEQLRKWLQSLMTRLSQDWRRRRAELGRTTVEKSIGVSTEAWVSSIKSDEREHVRAIVEAVTSDEADIAVEQQGEILGLVKGLAPLHAEFVWRHLHAEIQRVTKPYYEGGDFYTAVIEAIKRYVNSVRAKHADLASIQEHAVLEAAFASVGKLDVFQKFMSLHGFSEDTSKNIQSGQKSLSIGVLAGFRNPLSHEEIDLLQSSGAFTYEDCLDALAIISHLMRRLDQAEVRSI
ncbi:TIGR02391 family protein [Leifsonia sp. Root112D2]|uniref:TIGR02391 family protein n=1 Tax=Leifsonia sp. Root112D2 TaxID=1736426 RepID=UPI0007156EA9|nr:TIGR02391 family protein [Leifsonia sp. Root112D2]KQV06555.1 hypothetical protein ASC63_03770 [Leifsonia sp. Root112D2]